MSTPIFDFGQVLHVAHRGQDVEGAPQVLLDGLRLRGGLDDDEARPSPRRPCGPASWPPGPSATAAGLRRLRAAFGFAAAFDLALRRLRRRSRHPSPLVSAQKVVARPLLAQPAHLEGQERPRAPRPRRAPRRARPRRRGAASARAPTRIADSSARRGPRSGSSPAPAGRRARSPRARPPPTRPRGLRPGGAPSVPPRAGPERRPGTASTGTPCDRAQAAVMSAPLRSPARTTTTPRDSPDTIRFRAGKFERTPGVPSGVFREERPARLQDRGEERPVARPGRRRRRPYPRTAMVWPPASSAAAWAIPSMPRAPPETTDTPARASPAAISRARSAPYSSVAREPTSATRRRSPREPRSRSSAGRPAIRASASG